jgi:hypothetical protein
LPFNLNTHVRCLRPPLEHAPDHTASRLSVMRSVMDVPMLNDADPVIGTGTLIPVGVEMTDVPLRPVAVTVSVAV